MHVKEKTEPDEVQDECHMHDSHYKNTYHPANKQTNALKHKSYQNVMFLFRSLHTHRSHILFECSYVFAAELVIESKIPEKRRNNISNSTLWRTNTLLF